MRLLSCVFIAAFALPAAAADITATSKVDAVTVFPRGAEVSRTLRQALEAGSHTIKVSDLPAEAIPSSIRVEGSADGQLQIGSVDTRRIFVRAGDSAVEESRRKRLEEELERLNDELDQLRAIVETKEAQKTLVTNLASLPTRPAPRDAQGQTVDWNAIIQLIGTSMADIQRDLLASRVQMRETNKRIEDIKKQLAELAPGQEQRTEVEVAVRTDAPLTADLVIKYQVRQAHWEPLYDARLSTGTAQEAPAIVLTRRALIRQQTGEVWTDVVLALSTSQPSGRSSAPDLAPLVVDFQQPPPAPVGGLARKAMPSATATRQFNATPRAIMEDEARTATEGRVVAERAAAEESASQLEGTAFQAQFAVPDRVTIVNTGDPKGVKLQDSPMKPILSVRTVPKRSATAYLYARLTLPDAAPYLPGRVSLFRDGSFVGTGYIPALAPGAQHELGFGLDANVTVKYIVRGEKKGESGIISSSRTDQRDFTITVENGHARPIDLTVVDQLPVSLNEEITVQLTGTPPSKRNYDDKRGLLAWEGSLEAGKKREINFGYSIAWPADKEISVHQAAR